MNCEKIISLYNQNGIVKFKMYGLEYTIEKSENCVVIFANQYQNKKSKFNSIEELLKYYFIYNENIESNDNRIQNIY